MPFSVVPMSRDRPSLPFARHNDIAPRLDEAEKKQPDEAFRARDDAEPQTLPTATTTRRSRRR